jgi:hypothetical protein
VLRNAGRDNLLAIPLAPIIGIPPYARAEAVIRPSATPPAPAAPAAPAVKGMLLVVMMARIIGSAVRGLARAHGSHAPDRGCAREGGA